MMQIILMTVILNINSVGNIDGGILTMTMPHGTMEACKITLSGMKAYFESANVEILVAKCEAV